MASETMELNGDAFVGESGEVSDFEHNSIIQKDHKCIRQWEVRVKV